MAFRCVLVTISQLITFTDLSERFVPSAEECQTAYKSLDMRWQFMKRSSSHSLTVGVQNKGEKKGLLLDLLPYVHMVPQRSLQHSQAEANTSWCWFFRTSFRWRMPQSSPAAAQPPHISSLHAFEVSAGLGPTSVHSDPFHPGRACCVEVRVWQ